MPSGSSSQSTPKARSTCTMVATRSLSFTRSSSASRIVVCAVARAARAHAIGIRRSRAARSAADERAAELGRPRRHLRHGLAGLLALRHRLHAAAHEAHDLEEPRARRVGADATHRHARARRDVRRDHEERGRRRVPGMSMEKPPSFRSSPRVELHRRRHRSAARRARASCAPCDRARASAPLNHGAVRVEPREQDRALHLGARDLRLVLELLQVVLSGSGPTTSGAVRSPSFFGWGSPVITALRCRMVPPRASWGVA